MLGRILTLVLMPVSWLWSAAVWLQARRYDISHGASVEGLKVVSVGNVAVGGTGKTPMASWITRAAVGAGAHPTLLLGREGWDEALLHRSWTPLVPVLVNEHRVEAAERARASGADVAVMDDGFQHRALARGLDIVLLAVEDRFPSHVLPCGPYRETARALARADAVILTRRGGTVEQARRLERAIQRVRGVADTVVKGSVRLTPSTVRPLVGDADFEGFDDPVAVTAIARPDVFLREVTALSQGPTQLLAFRDHHEFSVRDARNARVRAGRRAIVVTEKDAVKLGAFHDVLGEVWVLGQRFEWDWGEEVVRSLVTSFVSTHGGEGRV